MVYTFSYNHQYCIRNVINIHGTIIYIFQCYIIWYCSFRYNYMLIYENIQLKYWSNDIKQLYFSTVLNTSHFISVLLKVKRHFWEGAIQLVVNDPHIYYKYRGNISSRFSSNSEAFASELLENLEEMFLRYI